MASKRDCRVCGGDGFVEDIGELKRNQTNPNNDCPACKGTGREPDREKVA